MLIDADSLPNLNNKHIFKQLREKGWVLKLISINSSALLSHKKRYGLITEELIHIQSGHESVDNFISMILGFIYSKDESAETILISNDRFIIPISENLRLLGYDCKDLYINEKTQSQKGNKNALMEQELKKILKEKSMPVKEEYQEEQFLAVQ